MSCDELVTCSESLTLHRHENRQWMAECFALCV